jgi:hypothetical protein
MPAPPTVPVISFMSPVLGDTMLTEAHNTELGAYRELPIGTPHPDIGKYPGYVLIHQQPFAGDEKWIQRFWSADEVLPETFNLKSRTFDGDDITKDVYERTYAVRRKDYEPTPKLTNFSGVLYVRMVLAGTGYDNTATVTFSLGGGSGATGVPIVFRGSIYGVRITNEGTGYTDNPDVTFSAPASGVTATGTAVLQNLEAVLTDERADRMDGDPQDGVYLRVTRVYRTLPGATTYKYFYDEQKGAVEQSAQLVAATGSEQGSIVIGALTRQVAAIRIDDNGAGYTSTPIVSFTGGSGGSGATATATLSSRQLATAPIAVAGSGYTTAPDVNFSGGGGSGAMATAVLAPTSVNTLTLSAAGSGYSGALSVRITGDGRGATGTATYGVSTGSFTITPNTTQYSATPTFTFGPGTGATGTVLWGISAGSFSFAPGTNQYSVNPAVTITSGGGTGATATALMAVSAASFTITGNTSTYSVAPTVTISGGGGTGATATATLGAGLVTGITITAAGSGFTSAPTIGFSGGTYLVPGIDPTGVGNATHFTAVGATITAPGTGFSTTPTITFSGGTTTFSGTTTTGTGNTTHWVVAGVTVTGAGSGFLSTAPTLVISGGTITSALVDPAATGNATNFAIGSVTKTASGSGYTIAPTATFVSTNGNGGMIAVALNTTSVASLTITSGGDDFTSAPTVTIAAPVSGVTATCTSPTLTTASVQDITVTAAGSGYTSAPNVVFTGGGFTTAATATAIIGAKVIETRYEGISTVLLRKITEEWVLPGPTVTAPTHFEDESGSRITESRTFRQTSDIVERQAVIGSALRIIEKEKSGISTLISVQVVTTYAKATHYSLGTAKISEEMRPYQFPGTIDIALLDYLGTAIGNKRATAILTPHFTYEFWVNSLLEPNLALEEIIPATIYINAVRYDNVLHDATTRSYSNSDGGVTLVDFPATTPSFSTYSAAWIGTFRAVDGGVKPLRVYRWKASLTFVRMQ